jgi:hypothetical protein
VADLGRHYLVWSMWELLKNEVRLAPTEQPPGLRGELDRIVVKRTIDYAIDASASGTPHEDWHERREHRLAGAEIPPMTVGCKDEFDRSCQLAHCVPGNESLYYTKVGNTSVPEWSVNLHPNEVTRRESGEREADWLTEWYINAPRSHAIFTRTIEWSAQHSYRRTIQEESASERSTEIDIGFTSRECAVVSFDFVKLILYDVPDDFEPTWSRKLAIEYRREAGRIPDAGERDGISSLLSFLFGRRLLNIGETTFSGEGHRIQDRATNPRSFNPRRLDTQSSIEPLPIRKKENGIPGYFRSESGAVIPKLENVLEELLPRYMEARKKFGLDLAIERCLSVPELYLDLQLPLLRIVLETIANSWFRAQGKPRRIKSGTTTKFKTLLDGLGLPRQAVEMRTLNAANQGAHVKALDTDAAISQAIDETRAMQTLVNRVILKLLDYDGPYIDYSTLGFPERPFSEPLGGATKQTK